ncbi:MAG: glycosyltransferase family 4 protein [Patescibacteria group bacterium]|nr:glycosyltransferase family 4 protein [Patescibacteria group bacterium]
MSKKLNILVFKFALALGGGERFNFVIGKEFKKKDVFIKFYSNFKPFLKRMRSIGVSTRKIYWGQEVGARRYLPQYFFLLPLNLIRFFCILLFNKKRARDNIVIFQSLNEKIFATSLARFLGYKVFWVEHLSVQPWLVKSFFKKSYVRKSDRVNKIIVISETIKKELIESLGISAGKIEVVYSGVDLNEFHILDPKTIENEKKKYGFFKGSKIIGFVGRLEEEKGLDILINAFYQLSRRFDHLYLLLVGDGLERSRLEAQAARLGLEKKVLFSGYKENVPLFFNLIDVFVLPSIIRESFGIVLTESMACGKVVVASNLGGIPEIINNGVDGFLFRPGDEKELASILSRVLSDEKLAQDIEAKALIRIKKYFSVDVTIKKLMEIFSK